MMTGGQISLSLNNDHTDEQYLDEKGQRVSKVPLATLSTPIIYADEAELAAHQAKLEEIDTSSGGKCIWLQQ